MLRPPQERRMRLYDAMASKDVVLLARLDPPLQVRALGSLEGCAAAVGEEEVPDLVVLDGLEGCLGPGDLLVSCVEDAVAADGVG